MTVALIVTTAGRQTGKAIIEKETFVIGRSSRCDLVLDDKNVSREHTIIIGKEGRYEIRDRGSRNGTSLNGVQLTAQMPLKDGDKIQIGPFELCFLAGAAPEADGERDLSKTRFVDSAGAPAPEKGKRALPKRKGGGLVYKLHATEGPLRGESWTNWLGEISFGRGPGNQVILQDDVVSQSHARITRDESVFTLEDMGSSNGTFLQGVRVRSARLKNNQRIRIGSSTFVFTVADPERKKFLLTLTAISVVFMAVVVGLIAVLIPADQVEPLVQQGLQFGKNGDFLRAKEIFEQALQLEPGNPRASKYLRDVNDCIERERILLAARSAADNEQFDEAMDICSKLLVKHPNYRKAKDLEAIVGKVKDAQTALDARNWADAAKLLAKAVESYPDSAILARRLSQAKAERTAQENLAKARELLAQSQPENAGELLTAIPASSVYSLEAKELLQNMKSADLLTSAIVDAQAAYRRGSMPETRANTRKGLKLSPGNAELLAIEKKLGDIEPLWKELQSAKELVNSDDVAAIRRALDTCRKITVTESDSQNYFRQQADQVKLLLDQALGEIERNAIAKGDSLMKENKREAYKYYAKAASVNPGNSAVKKIMDSINADIAGECQKVFREGLVYEETGQTDLAIAAYEKVLRIAVDGDRYSERAKDKLRQLKK